jgi:hypothetical protein
MKHKFLSKRLKGMELIIIEVERWKQLDEREQYAFLYQLSRFKDASSSLEPEIAF